MLSFICVKQNAAFFLLVSVSYFFIQIALIADIVLRMTQLTLSYKTVLAVSTSYVNVSENK